MIPKKIDGHLIFCLSWLHAPCTSYRVESFYFGQFIFRWPMNDHRTLYTIRGKINISQNTHDITLHSLCLRTQFQGIFTIFISLFILSFSLFLFLFLHRLSCIRNFSLCNLKLIVRMLGMDHCPYKGNIVNFLSNNLTEKKS